MEKFEFFKLSATSELFTFLYVNTLSFLVSALVEIFLSRFFQLSYVSRIFTEN